MRKPEVGETLFSLNIGNAARNSEQVLTPVVVAKVGRKYFTVREGWKETKYRLSDWLQVTDYSPDSCLYESEQEWEDETLSRVLAGAIGEAFKYGRNIRALPSVALLQIFLIVFGGPDNAGK